MLNFDYLEARGGERLTKRFLKRRDGSIDKTPYPRTRDFTSYRETASTIEEFYKQMCAHAEHGHCLLKGLLDRPLINESRAGHTNREQPTSWMVLDNDHLHELPPPGLMQILGLGDVDHIVQHSASSGLVPGHNGYHIFFFLSEPYTPADLKLRLEKWNLTYDIFAQHLSLTASKNALRYPIDISVCQNDKLLYIAPPVCGEDLSDPYPDNRIQLVEGSRRAATFGGHHHG